MGKNKQELVIRSLVQVHRILIFKDVERSGRGLTEVLLQQLLRGD
jgi:hypothetical protein